MAASRDAALTAALIGAVAIAAGCGGDGSSRADELERVEKRYERLWNAESVSCREAPGREGYECRIVSKQRGPGAPTSGYDVVVPPPPSPGEP